MEIDGRPVMRVIIESQDRTEEVAAIDWAPNEVVLVIADSRSDDYAAYQPWFRHVLLAIEPLGESSTDVGEGPPGDVLE